MKNIKQSLGLIALLQALGLTGYCSLVAVLFWRGNQLFGKVPNYLGPFLFLVIFSTSALVCALMTLGYPFLLFWEKKQTRNALKIILYTAGWLIVVVLLIFLLILLLKNLS